MAASNFFAWITSVTPAVTLLIILVMIIRRPVARYFGPETAYLLWLAPVLRLALPELKILPASQSAAFVEPIEPTFAFASIAGTGQSLDIAAPWLPNAATNSAQESTGILAAVLGFIWLCGAVIYLGRTILAQTKFRSQSLRSSTSASGDLAAEAAVVAAKLNVKKYDLRISEGSDGPLVTGLFDPIILVPSNFEQDYSPEERSFALSHELSHIRRGDLAANLFGTAIVALNWPNPFFHAAYRQFRADQEAACDAAVLSRTQNAYQEAHSAYASTILKSIRTRPVSPAVCLSISHPLKERLSNMKHPLKTPSHRSRLLVAGAILAAVSATASYSQADQSETEVKTVEREESKSSSRESIISVDGNEVMVLEGLDGKSAAKIVYKDKNGRRSLRVYDSRGRSLLNERYAEGETMPYGRVTVLKDGEITQEFDFSADTMEQFHFKDGKRVVIAAPPHPPRPPHPGHPDVNAMVSTHCGDERRDEDVHVFSWTSDEDSDGETQFIQKEVICITDDTYSGEPEKRAEALRKAIKILEEDAQRAEERRLKAIEDLRGQLEKLESEQ
ncbi:MAG: M56 family metallopeptidase [Pseudomonadota bacterium]